MAVGSRSGQGLKARRRRFRALWASAASALALSAAAADAAPLDAAEPTAPAAVEIVIDDAAPAVPPVVRNAGLAAAATAALFGLWRWLRSGGLAAAAPQIARAAGKAATTGIGAARKAAAAIDAASGGVAGRFGRWALRILTLALAAAIGLMAFDLEWAAGLATGGALVGLWLRGWRRAEAGSRKGPDGAVIPPQ